MVKSQLVAQLVQEYPHLTYNQVDRAVDLIFETVIATLERGGRVELRGFGVFSVRARVQRKGRNPKTGEAVQVPGKKMPHFKGGRPAHDRLNGLKLPKPRTYPRSARASRPTPK